MAHAVKECSTDSAAMPVAEKWHQLVAKHMANGLTRAAAVAKAVAANPQLHAAYLAAANGRETPTVAADSARATAEWEGVVAANIAAGMTKWDAVQKAATERPDLHAAYLRSYNART